MFEHLLLEIGALQGETRVSVSIEADAEGYLDRECPVETCLFAFKVLDDDWGALVKDEAVFCPMCRHEAPSDQWHTRAQVEGSERFAFSHVSRRIGRAIRTDARAQNARRRSGSLVTITMEVKGPPDPPMSPVAASEPMRLRATCEACNCRYSYIGSAFFCPACGHNSAAATFSQSMENARRAAIIRQQLVGLLDVDAAENAARLLREKAATDIVMSVQRLAERVWEDLPDPKPTLKENVFQRLDDASALWLGATSRGFDSLLAPTDLARLKVYYQRRHLLSHREGIVDEKYLAKSGDTRFSLGQRITVDETSLLEFAALAEQLGNGLLGFLHNRPAVPQAQPPIPVLSPPAAPTKLRNRRGLSADAEAVAKVFVERSENGRDGDPYLQPDDLRSALSLPDHDIVEAMDELERAGLMNLHTACGMDPLGFHIATPLGGMFEIFDPVFMIGDPLSDAAILGQSLIEAGDDGVVTSKLATKLGWTARRMNPAVWSLTCRGIADGSQELDPIWDCVWLRAKPGLRRFIRGESR